MLKKKSNIKRTTGKCPQRLPLAKDWIAVNPGKNIVRSYTEHFRVDPLCAIAELRLLGVSVTDEYEVAVRRSLAPRMDQKRKKKERAKQNEWPDEFQNEEFSFIAGYTGDGAPYGSEWEDTPDKDMIFQCSLQGVIPFSLGPEY